MNDRRVIKNKNAVSEERLRILLKLHFLCHRKIRPMTQKRSARMRSDSVKNISAYADQNHAPSLTDVRLECVKVI